MQLDRSHIAIRERSLLEIMDLALHVIRAYAPGWVVCCVIGCGPMLLLDWWLVAGFLGQDDNIAGPIACGLTQLLLVVVQTPVATAPLTLYLGQRMFQEQTDPAALGRDFFASLPQLFTLQLLVRTVCTPFLITLALPLGFWPYLSEVILLERSAMLRRERDRSSTIRRARSLHAGVSSFLFGRWLATTVLVGLLGLSLWLSLWVILSILTGGQHSLRTGLLVYWPVALWLTAAYLAVVRFLAYLDLRMRREGWEMTLVLRAEAARMARSMP